MIVRAISIKQPFVEQILRGIKRNEFRSRLTRIRERVYIYASLKDRPEKHEWNRIGKLPGQLPTGKIVGSVEIVGCVQRPNGEYAYKLANPRRLRKFLVAKNQPQPGFWLPQL